VTTDAELAEHVVDGDEDLLHRAVFNLLLNAIQASPEGGEVQLAVRPHFRSTSAARGSTTAP
jgi:signal transduction histidine kinase